VSGEPRVQQLEPAPPEQYDRDVARAVPVVPRAVGEVATKLGSEAVVDGVVDDAPRRVWACSTIG
jgi:hypothetical protein